MTTHPHHQHISVVVFFVFFFAAVCVICLSRHIPIFQAAAAVGNPDTSAYNSIGCSTVRATSDPGEGGGELTAAEGEQ